MAKTQEVPNTDSGTDSEPVEQTKQTEFEKYKAFNNRTVDYDKLKRKLNEALGQIARKDTSDSLKFVHELKQEMHADLKYVESLEKEIDELESEKAEFSDMYDVILHDCVSKDVMCSYLQSLSDLDALVELQCMYHHKVKECDCLTQKLSKQTESVSKKVHTELLQRFAKLEKHSISLEITLQKCKEQVKNDTVCNEKASNDFRKEREQYFKIQDLKAQMEDKNIAISELKKLIEQGKGKSVDTMFDRPSVVRQPNAQRIPKPSVLGKPTPVLDSLERRYFPKTKSVPKTNVSEGLSKQVTAQTLPQTAKKAVRVNHKPNVSRPQIKSNQSRDKVLPNNSYVKVKKTQVEVHPRNPSVSNNMKSVTACQDSLNSRTLNDNDVCATCNKCLGDSNHFACVTKMLNDMHARTKKPTVIIQLILFIVDSRCTKHMTGDLKLLCNFVEKVYYVEGLNHNLFSVGQFCDADLEVTFRKSTCFVRDLQGNDLLIDADHAGCLDSCKSTYGGIQFLGTVNMGLWYPKGSSFGLIDFLDDDHVGCIDTRKITSRGLQFLCDKLVRWMSKKQDCTAMSSTEAEYVALSTSCAQGSSFELTGFLDADHAGCIDSRKSTSGGIQFLEAEYVALSASCAQVITEHQLADMFTKTLPKDRFKYLVRRIGMRCLTPAELEVLANESA
nr:hypothetical protein [Tanacetum cinerariifolium]